MKTYLIVNIHSNDQIVVTKLVKELPEDPGSINSIEIESKKYTVMDRIYNLTSNSVFISIQDIGGFADPSDEERLKTWQRILDVY